MVWLNAGQLYFNGGGELLVLRPRLAPLAGSRLDLPMNSGDPNLLVKRIGKFKGSCPDLFWVWYRAFSTVSKRAFMSLAMVYRSLTAVSPLYFFIKTDSLAFTSRMFFMASWASFMVVFTLVIKSYCACMSATLASARGSGKILKSWVAIVWSPHTHRYLVSARNRFGTI